MLISFYGIENGNESFIKIETYVKEETKETEILISINNEIINLKDDYQGIICKIYKYSEEINENFRKRTFFQFFKKYEGNLLIENMIRAFAVCSHFFQFNFPIPLNTRCGNQFFTPNIIRNLNFYDRALLDCDNNLIEQPSMYFLKQELIDGQREKISELFNLGMLQKLQISDNNQEKSFYYIPFVHSENDNIKRNEFWKSILEDYDSAIKNQTKGQWIK